MPKLSINLLPKRPLGELSLKERLAHWLAHFGRIIIIGTEVILLLGLAFRFKLDHDVDTLSHSLGEKQAILRSAYAFERKVRFIQEKISALNFLLEHQVILSPFLSDFSAMLPSRITLSALSLSEEEFNLSAKAPSGLDFARLVNNLLSSQKFEDLILTQVSFDAKERLYKFSLEAVFKSQ